MKTLSYYKSLYKKAKTHKGKESAMNSAVLNLSYSDKETFIKWQIKTMNEVTN